MGMGGAVPKDEQWVSHDVLKTQTVLVNEGNRDGTMPGIWVSGHQPVGVTKQDEVLKTDISGELDTKVSRRW